MSIQSIHFINRYPVIKYNKYAKRQDVEWNYVKVDFQLGLGPCGKVVAGLDATYTDHTFTIHQHHEDGTSKDFIYQMEDVAGRIVVEYTEEQENV